jgi:hypothetical protein
VGALFYPDLHSAESGKAPIYLLFPKANKDKIRIAFQFVYLKEPSFYFQATPLMTRSQLRWMAFTILFPTVKEDAIECFHIHFKRVFDEGIAISRESFHDKNKTT